MTTESRNAATIQRMNKAQLRAALKEAGISYSGMTVAEMKDRLLQHHEDEILKDAGPGAVIAPASPGDGEVAEPPTQKLIVQNRPSLSDLAASIPVGKTVDLKALAEQHGVRADSLRTVCRDITTGVMRKGSGLMFELKGGKLTRTA
jgi:hypothetical protein